MDKYARSLGLVLFTLSILLLFAIALGNERREFAAGLRELEQALLGLHLVEMPGGATMPAAGAATDEDTEKLDDSEALYGDFKSFGEIEALGQWMADTPWQHYRETNLARSFALVMKLQLVSPDPGWDDFEECRINDSRDYANRQRALPQAEGAERQSFLLAVDFLPASNLVFPPTRYFLSNKELFYRPAQQDYCVGNGAIGLAVGDAPPARLSDLVRRDALLEKALRAAQELGLYKAIPGDAYAEARIQFERDRITVPVIGVAANANQAILLVAGLAVGLAAWASFLLRQLAALATPANIGDPVPFIDPLLRWRGDASQPPTLVATAEIVIFTLYYAALAVSPAAIGLVMFETVTTTQPALIMLKIMLLALAALFSASLIIGFMELAEQLRRPVKAAETKTARA